MKQLLVTVVALGLLVSVFHSSRAASSPVSVSVARTPEVVADEVIAPVVTAKAYSVIDIETGKQLLAYNATEELPIASVTKLFTAAALAISETEEVVINNEDVATEGRAGKLKAGQTYTTDELLFPLLLESSNDAAAALERTVDNLSFNGKPLADASGLSSANRASAEVLAKAVRELYQNQPHLFDITRLRQYVGEYTGWVNNSPVRDLPGYRGGKHGYTVAAGKTLAAIFAEPSLDERELAYVILGSDDLKADTIALREAVAYSVHLE